MEKSKIEIKIGNVKFMGEGDASWLEKQLDKFLNKVPELLKLDIIPPSETISEPTGDYTNTNDSKSEASSTSNVPSNLSVYLREKNTTSNQTNKFLVTAAFIQQRGQRRISTTDVTKALKDSNQSRLGNASDKLNKNVSKGFCEKDGAQFFVTQEGLEFVKKMK